MTTPISPPPVDPSKDSVDGDRLPAYLSNGVVGLRVGPTGWQGGLGVLSGLAGIDPVMQVEAGPTVPFPLAGDLRVDGLWMSDAPERVHPGEQQYDFATGELSSSFT